MTAASTTSVDLDGRAPTGNPLGNYAIDVIQAGHLVRNGTGRGRSAAGLSPTSDVNGLTLASLPTAQPVTAGHLHDERAPDHRHDLGIAPGRLHRDRRRHLRER